MRLTAARLVGAMGQLLPRKSICWSAFTRRRRWRARCRSSKADGRQGRPRGGALSHGSVPSIIGAVACGAADGGILVSDLAIEHDLSSRVVADVFVSQERDQALLQGSKAAF